jgi:hypothetical protein
MVLDQPDGIIRGKASPKSTQALSIVLGNDHCLHANLPRHATRIAPFSTGVTDRGWRGAEGEEGWEKSSAL